MLRSAIAVAVAARDLLLTIAVLIVASPLWFLPWRIAVSVGRIAGGIGSIVWGKARRAGLINLKRAYPELTALQARAMTTKVFRNLGASIAEGIQFSRRFRAPGSSDRMFVLEDPDLGGQILADPRPKIFVTGHLGSWEVALMIAGSVIGGRGAVIARSVDNRSLDAVIRKIRFEHPSLLIEKRGAVPEALQRLRNGDSIAMLIDENGGPRGPHVDFFGRRASTRKTPALLSLMTGAPIVVGAALRRPNAPFLFRLSVIDPAAFAGASVVSITTEINRILEQWIRDDVDQWRWIHWRWRTRPDGTSETYTRADVHTCFGEGSPGTTNAGARGEA